MYVQYGCQFSAPLEWVNFDSSFTLKWERLPVAGKLYTKNEQRFPANVRIGDIVKGLPVPDASCAGVYASHVLEHLALDEFHIALGNTLRILRPGGVFRLVVPDLEWAAAEYLRRLKAGEPDANSFFMTETYLGRRRRPRGPREFVHAWLRTSEHMWMWDQASLQHVLQEHGFNNVRRCAFNDCEDGMFKLVENPGRFRNAVAMQARRP